MIKSKYTRDDIINHELPGANSVINAIHGQPDFSMINKDVLARATQRGSDIHDAIEQFILTGKQLDESYPLEYDIYFDAFYDWYNKYQPEFLAAELPFIHHDRNYKGIIDCVAKVDGKVVIIDWKTSAKLDKYKAMLQQTLYTLALSEIFGIEVDEVRVLSITRRGFVYYKFDYDPYVAIALLLLKEKKDELT